MGMLYKNIVAIIAFGLLLGVFMVSTNPGNFSAPLLLIVFSLLYLLVATLCLLLFQVLVKLRILHMNFMKMVRMAALCGVLPVFMLLLHSIGQLTIRDVVLSLTFFALLYFYFNRITVKRVAKGS